MYQKNISPWWIVLLINDVWIWTDVENPYDIYAGAEQSILGILM